MINLDKILQKLEPLMSNQVEHWCKVMEIGSPELKELIEKQIISIAYKKLGNFHKEILLSLPSKNKSRGMFNLGTVIYKDEKWPVGLSKSEIMQNMAIFGRSGAGKTNVAFHIMKQLEEQNIPFLFLDWKRTARHLLPGLKRKVNINTPGRKLAEFKFNPFIPPVGLEHNVYINQIVDILAEAYTLGDGSKSVLQKAISVCYQQGKSTVKDIIQQIEKMPDKGRVGNWKISALRAMESLDFADITSTNQLTQQEMTYSLLRENTIIELDALSQNAKKFIIPVLCLWLYYVRLASPVREELSFVIFLEEAHHVLYKQEKRSSEMPLEMLLRQCREIGIGIIVIDQHPHLISSAVLGNSFTSICLNLKDPSDINKAAAMSLVDSDEKNCFSMLPVGHGIVKLQDRWRRPFLVKFPAVNVQKGSVSDGDISNYLRLNKTGSGRKTSKVLEFGQSPQVPLFDNSLNNTSFEFLQDIITHPDDGVKLRYKRLNLSTGSGNRIKEQLLEHGWIESQAIAMGKTRKTALRLTKKAAEYFEGEISNTGYGSIAHEYWKRYYGYKFHMQGYQINFEVPRKYGRVDVVASKGNGKIAIEIETGKSDFIKNVKHDLSSRFNKVLIVATDKKAFKKIEYQIAKEGLFIPERVEIIAAGS
ncbi:MAG: hypothetical protein A2Y10_06075 [Planctomycetes bacterium GWF2_41_51]|nr:MAG: hypothetical protein A2Y10_06075 [Planctomycetes bacterium GWF2_41_51]